MTKADETQGSSVSRLLAERAKLDEKIRQDHTRDVTIFFCDIKGYTSYTETHGDLAGRALAQRVNDIAFPALEKHGGRLVKTIGDAIMASFEEPVDAVRFAIDLQRQLKEDNKNHQKVEQVQLRIGINLGEAIVDEGDLYGDAVNIAARIEPHAIPGGILISPSLYDQVRDLEDIVAVYAKKVAMKGKAESMDLYQVAWDGDRLDDYQEATAAPAGATEALLAQPAGNNLFKGAVLVFILFLIGFAVKVTLFDKDTGSINGMISDAYQSGYSLLRSGAIDLAGAAFNKLDSNDPRYAEAKTAIAMWQKDYPAAEKYLSQAIAKADDRVFVHVLDGDLKLHNGQQENALVSYRKATVVDKGLDWHRALAYNGQGRILTAMDRKEDALASYVKAARLAPGEADILTNQGVLLETLGRSDEAMKSYQQALKANPEDLLARKKLALAEQREKAKLNREKQDQINKLVDELAARFKSGEATAPTGDVQGGSITYPVTIWVMNFDEKGDLPLREGENEVFVSLLGQELQESGEVEQVERDILDSLLTELKLGSSQLADKSTSLQLGRLLSAKLIITGKIYRRGAASLVSFKVIETETSRIRASASIEVTGTDGLLMSVPKVSEAILSKLSNTYPNILMGGKST
ncbi:adenylate/guanylate cyclase domain-containing protein [Thermodesulfobacteriota bacterium]